MLDRITVTFDRPDGSNKDEVKPIIEEAIELLKPMEAKLRIRVTKNAKSTLRNNW
jgi:hypothetical protein